MGPLLPIIDLPKQSHRHITKWVSQERLLDHITAILVLTHLAAAYSSAESALLPVYSIHLRQRFAAALLS